MVERSTAPDPSGLGETGAPGSLGGSGVCSCPENSNPLRITVEHHALKALHPEWACGLQRCVCAPVSKTPNPKKSWSSAPHTTPPARCYIPCEKPHSWSTTCTPVCSCYPARYSASTHVHGCARKRQHVQTRNETQYRDYSFLRSIDVGGGHVWQSRTNLEALCTAVPGGNLGASAALNLKRC